MHKKPDSLSTLTETNSKSPYPPFQNAASTDDEEEKWDLGWLVTVTRRRALLMVQVALGTTVLAGGLLFLMSKLPPPHLGS